MGLRLKARTSVPAPLEMCWERLVDVDALLERVPHRRVEVTRIAGAGTAHVGAAWRVGVHVAGRDHRGTVTLTELTPQEHCRLRGGSDSLGLDLRIAMSSISEAKCGLEVSAEVTPLTFSGRLLLKPLQVMKPALEARFRTRVDWVVQQMMDRD